MSATTTLCHLSKNSLNQKLLNRVLVPTPEKTIKSNSGNILKLVNYAGEVILPPIVNDGSVSKKEDVVSDMSKTTCVKELAAAVDRLEREKELVHELQSKFQSHEKLAIGPKAFRGAASSSKSADVKMLMENRNSCFRQYSDCFYELRQAVLDEYNKRLSYKKIENTRSVECSNEQIDGEELKRSEILESSEKDSSDDNEDPPRVSFKIDLNGIRNFKNLHNFAKNCRVLARRFLRFKKKFDCLPSDCDVVVLEGFYREIKAYPFYFKLVEQINATSEKMEVYLERTCGLLSNLVSKFLCFKSENMDVKRKSVENFARASEVIGTFLQTLNIPLSKLAYMAEIGSKYYKDLIIISLKDIFNLVRYFKNIFHRDLPCRDDLISWAYDLRDCAFAMCCCEPCFT